MNNAVSTNMGVPLGNDFMHNSEAPVGFKMMLAQNTDALDKFASLPEPQQRALIDGARQISNPEEMQVYVLNVLQG